MTCCLGSVQDKLEAVRRRLAARGNQEAAREVGRLARRLGAVAKRLAVTEHIPGVPAKVNEIYEAVRDEHPEYSKEKCAKIAWSTYNKQK